MTAFAQQGRFYCRNPRCRCKLPAPIGNLHRAFCTRGCYTSFYLKRCLVCENEKPAGRARLLCRRPRCSSEYARDRSFFTFGYPGSGIATNSSKSAHFTGLKTGGLGRPWRVVAGEIAVLRAAVVPDGPDCQWKGGAFERAEAISRAALTAVDTDDCFTEPNWGEVISPDGVRCWVTRRRPQSGAAPSDWTPCLPRDWESLPDLSIPDFMRRR